MIPRIQTQAVPTAADRGAAFLDGRIRHRAHEKLRQPPFAKRIHEMRAANLGPRLMAWVVDGWAAVEDPEQQFGDWMVVVPDDTPLQFVDFRCLTGLQVLIQARDRGRVHDIAEQVFRFHPGQIWGFVEDEDALTYFAPVDRMRRAA